MVFNYQKQNFHKSTKNGLEIVLKKISYFLSMQNLGPILQKKIPLKETWRGIRRKKIIFS